MAHDDIWDDSALVNSWNEALSEYKKYHSIHATGANIDDLLSSELSNQQHAKPETRADDHAEPAPSPREGQAAPAAPSSNGQDQSGTPTTNDRLDAAELSGNGVIGGDGPGQSQGISNVSGGAGVTPSPETLLGSVQDEDMKRLLMSWYYAGYYTGLHEGQQKQRRQL